MSNEGFEITLSGEELLEWCTYQNSGKVLSFVAPLKHFDNKICGVILCATLDEDKVYPYMLWAHPAIHNKTKGTSHLFGDCRYFSASMLVMFYPLNDTILLVEAGDTVELHIDNADEVTSCGLRLVYENDVVDSGLVLKNVKKPTLSLFPLSSESEIMTGNSITC